MCMFPFISMYRITVYNWVEYQQEWKHLSNITCTHTHIWEIVQSSQSSKHSEVLKDMLNILEHHVTEAVISPWDFAWCTFRLHSNVLASGLPLIEGHPSPASTTLSSYQRQVEPAYSIHPAVCAFPLQALNAQLPIHRWAYCLGCQAIHVKSQIWGFCIGGLLV